MHEHGHKALRGEHNLRPQCKNSEQFRLQVFTKHPHHGKQSSVTPQIVQCGSSSSPQLRDKTLNFVTRLFAPIHCIQTGYTSQTMLFCLFFFFLATEHQPFGDRHIDLWYFIGNKYCSLTKPKEILRIKKNKQMIRNNVCS